MSSGRWMMSWKSNCVLLLLMPVGLNILKSDQWHFDNSLADTSMQEEQGPALYLVLRAWSHAW